ncbi:Beta-glucosidase 22 [Camellia lanceoleosa]|uniref:Beta-glucosidase 22 n=1 Tax=Camellia lanceoleosa TaxID=1840588 RepID=A0ACC0FU04_9ERIC|nr:Beta-glucosidase 22 [Camellia lanceoleosa]
MAYAEVCFREFGDRVLYWTTFNEVNVFVLGGYDVGITPPKRCSFPFGINCSKGNSSSEPYIVAHNILLAHASAANLYKNKIINPLVFGDYPKIVKKNAGSRIPEFTKVESKLVKGSFDFLGLNHYNTLYIKDKPSSLKINNRDFNADMAVDIIPVSNDTPPDEFPITPSGLLGVLEYFKQFYGNPPIYIHENGEGEEEEEGIDPKSNELVDPKVWCFSTARVHVLVHSLLAFFVCQFNIVELVLDSLKVVVKDEGSKRVVGSSG